MIWAIITTLFLIACIVGCVMVNKISNYYNLWGIMLWGGAIAFIISIIGKLIVVIISAIIALF